MIVYILTLVPNSGSIPEVSKLFYIFFKGGRTWKTENMEKSMCASVGEC